MKKYSVLVLLLVVVALLFSGCADVTNIEPCVVEAQAHIYGFWGGLWHGLISPFAWIGSLFSDDIAIFAVANNGGWYNFGFGIGVVLWFGGGGSTATRSRR